MELTYPRFARLAALALAGIVLAVTALLGPRPAAAYSPFERYYGREEIEQLTAPIALYPDPLLAQILAAAAYPGEIREAHRYLGYRSDFDFIDRQDWASPVRAVARYPEVLDMMARDLDWTEALGIAQINQPDDVADAIQRWRLIAWELGNLRSTPQQTVNVYGGYVRIVPGYSDYFYVPSYNPRRIYVERYNSALGPLLLFGTGYLIGTWFDLDWDWNRRRIYYYDRSYWYRGKPVFYPDFDRIHVYRDREWRPDPKRFRPPPKPSFPSKLTAPGKIPPPPPDFRPGVRRDSHPSDDRRERIDPLPKRIEPPKVEPRRVEPRRVEPKRVEPPKVEPKRVEPPKVEPKRVEPKRVEPKRVEPPKVEPKRSEPQRKAPSREEEEDERSRRLEDRRR